MTDWSEGSSEAAETSEAIVRCALCGEEFVYWFECEDDGCCPNCGADL